MDDWLELLTLFQLMHPQRQQLVHHVEYESREWMHPFNLYLSFASLHEHLLSWFRDEDASEAVPARMLECPPEPADAALPPVMLPSVHTFLHKLLGAVLAWQGTYFLPRLIPITLSSIPAGHVTIFAPQAEKSFHLLLHRLLASAIRSYQSVSQVLPVSQFQSVSRQG